MEDLVSAWSLLCHWAIVLTNFCIIAVIDGVQLVMMMVRHIRCNGYYTSVCTVNIVLSSVLSLYINLTIY